MPTATPEGRQAGRARSEPSRLQAFGLDLETSIAIPGAVPGAEGPRRRPVRVDLAARKELLEAWGPADPRRISNRRMPNGRAAITIDEDDRAGYLIRALSFGVFWISPGADHIRCAPVKGSAWRWQRYLVGQVLPLAAVLRGLEVFHASGVVMRDAAVTFIGMSTAGKTSVALNLVLRGAGFLTDDVLAVSPGEDGGVVAHPGVGLASLRTEAEARLDAAELSRLGQPLGRDDDAVRMEVECHPGDAPLRHAFLLDRRDEGPLLIERVRPVDPRILLGGSFNFVIRTPERLTNQLDLCARIATRVAVHRAAIPPSAGPAELAAAVERHLEEAGA